MLDAYVHTFVFPAAFALLPPRLDTNESRAELLAIALQETHFAARRQLTSNPSYAPARGFWQMELGGAVAEVLTNARTKPLILPILQQLRYPPAASACWEALEHNDILACLFARLRLYASPLAMPPADNAEEGWQVYVATWVPGKPHRATWDANYARAWSLTNPLV